MAGGGGSAVSMRLNIMTALYLPILLYAMSTFDLDENALVLDSNNLKPHVVANNSSVAVGDSYRASIMFTLRDDSHTAGGDNGHGDALFVPEIDLDYSKSPEALKWDSEKQELLMDTEKLFENVSPETYTKQVEFSGTIRGKTAKDLKEGSPASYIEDISGSFTVFRPTIQVQSNAVPKLYANCENSLSFTVPGVNTTSLFLKNKFADQTYEGNSITFSPSSDTALIEVYRKAEEGSSSLLGTKGFKVVEPPNPIVGIREENGNEFLKPGEAIGLFDTYELVIKANESFSNEFPKDSKYRLRSVKMEIVRRGLAPLEAEFTSSELKYDSRNEALGEYIYKFSAVNKIPNPQGSGVNIIINDLVRVNYAGRALPIDPTEVSSQFTFKAF